MNPIENEQLCTVTSQCLRNGVGSLSSLPGLLKKIIQTKAWEERQVSGGKIIRLKSLMELITAKPRDGWGEDPEKIKAVIKDDPEALAMFRDAMKGQEGGDKRSRDATTSNNVTGEEAVTGNSKAYTLSRLQKESPELFEAVCRKDLSANAAAIKAGFRKKPNPEEVCIKAFRKSENRVMAIRSIVKELTGQEREMLIEMLSGKDE